MSPRNRHYGGSPSPHDSTGPRSKSDIRRPLGAPPPDNPGLKSSASKGCVVALLAGLSGLGAVGGLIAAIVRAVS